nr:MAG TPA: type II DNA topoisomerase VI [Caudoviricetes sp.]
MPKIEYITKNFRSDSLSLIEKVNSVISDYAAQGYSLTLRQVYYQMVARAIIPNNERSYKNLGALINDARLAGLVDWNAIEDRTRNLKGRSHWTTPGDVIDSAAYSYHLDYWDGQRNYVEVWVEKDALVGIVGQVCHGLDVNYFSCRGYVSQSEMWGAAQRLRRQKECGRHIILLHLGDHDPSGIDMSRDIQERNVLFENFDMEFHRLALNMDQIENYGPPPNPTKLTDSRANGYIDNFGYECWELDALEPQVISDLITKNVLKYRNDAAYKRVKAQEEREKALLEDVAKNWGSVAENWDDIKEQYCEEA